MVRAANKGQIICCVPAFLMHQLLKSVLCAQYIIRLVLFFLYRIRLCKVKILKTAILPGFIPPFFYGVFNQIRRIVGFREVVEPVQCIVIRHYCHHIVRNANCHIMSTADDLNHKRFVLVCKRVASSVWRISICINHFDSDLQRFPRRRCPFSYYAAKISLYAAIAQARRIPCVLL